MSRRSLFLKSAPMPTSRLRVGSDNMVILSSLADPSDGSTCIYPHGQDAGGAGRARSSTCCSPCSAQRWEGRRSSPLRCPASPDRRPDRFAKGPPITPSRSWKAQPRRVDLRHGQAPDQGHQGPGPKAAGIAIALTLLEAGRSGKSRSGWPGGGGLWSAGPVPGDRPLHRVAVRGGLEAAEGGFPSLGRPPTGAGLGTRPAEAFLIKPARPKRFFVAPGTPEPREQDPSASYGYVSASCDAAELPGARARVQRAERLPRQRQPTRGRPATIRRAGIPALILRAASANCRD
jgi:hypothetical protein